jgi:hypothetical protein
MSSFQRLLAIEVDVISKTQLSAYEALGVPELWRYQHHRLQTACSKTKSMWSLTLARLFQIYRSLKSSLSTLNRVERKAEVQRSEPFASGQENRYSNKWAEHLAGEVKPSHPSEEVRCYA